MARRNSKSAGNKSAHVEDVVIPELEALVGSYKRKVAWTEYERAVLRKYWGQVPADAIAKQLGKSKSAVKNQVYHLKLSAGGNRE